jgi:hypothetical protein
VEYKELKMTPRGGKRQGAGRHRKFTERGRRVDIYLPEYQIKFLKMEGNMSKKIQKLIERDVHELADAVYHAAYNGMNDISDTSHYTTKTAEIYEWLVSGDPGNETPEQLAAEWLEYDVEPETE